MKISIINGPNLNLTGKREPDVYGTATFEDLVADLRLHYPGIDFTYFQSNIEGDLVTAIQDAGFSNNGIILNPGAYTHTSIAIGDAVAAVPCKVLEVHLSNIFGREAFRQHSHVSAKSAGVISGLGMEGYRLAVQWFLKQNI